VGQMLKLARPEVQIITTEPAGASLLRDQPWSPHKIQGWTPDFVPKVLDRTVYSQVIPVADSSARDMSLQLASQEGIFCGISSGANVVATLEVAKTAPAGSVLLTTLADTGERYLSTFLFENIHEGSDEDWYNSLS
jgi:cysteine synthase